MQAKEFLPESSRGSLLDAQSSTLPGVGFIIDGNIDLYRASMMVSGMPDDVAEMDPYSIVTGRPFIVTYCPEEQEMIRQAFKKMRITYKESVPQGSKEPEGVNTQSITKPFKGY